MIGKKNWRKKYKFLNNKILKIITKHPFHFVLCLLIKVCKLKTKALINHSRTGKQKKKSLEGGLEPPTLWLTATRSNQLSYSSWLMGHSNIIIINKLKKLIFLGYLEKLIFFHLLNCRLESTDTVFKKKRIFLTKIWFFVRLINFRSVHLYMLI